MGEPSSPGVRAEKPAEWSVKSVAEAERVINIQHRMLYADAKNIAHLYERIGWLSLPWWKRLVRRRPW